MIYEEGVNHGKLNPLSQSVMKPKLSKFLLAITILLLSAYFLLDSFLYDGVKPRAIDHHNFYGTFYAKEETTQSVGVILLGGGEWGDYWGQEMAKSGFTALSLPYLAQKQMPSKIAEIPLEYFEKTIDWFAQQVQVNPKKIIVMGASRNAELALVLASYIPHKIDGCIAIAPSAVSWSNTVMPIHSDSILPSWTYHSKPIAYLAMKPLDLSLSDTLDMLGYWNKGLMDTNLTADAIIPIEQINGPVLLLSGEDDNVWPSSKMSEMLKRRNHALNGKHPLIAVNYKDAGHLISGNPNYLNQQRYGNLQINNHTYFYAYGGTPKGDQSAQKDIYKQIFDYLNGIHYE